MATKSIKKNYIYNLCYQFLLIAIPLILTPYVSRVLGAEKIGTVSFAESIASYFVLFATMGLTTYGQREISYVRDSKYELSIVFWNTKIFGLIFSAISLFSFAVLSFFSDNPVLYYVFAINIVSVAFDITWFFQGLEEFGKIVIRNIVAKTLSLIAVILFVKNSGDYIKYALALTTFPLIGQMSLWGYLPKYVSTIKKEDIHPFKETKAILSLFIPTIAIQIYTVMDKTMLGLITGNDMENGYYEQALKVSRGLLVVVTALGTVMIPRIAYHFEKKEYDTVKNHIYNSYRFAWMIGVPSFVGLASLSSHFTPWYYGEGYDKVSVLLSVLSLLIIAIGINNVTGMQYLIPTKKQNTFTLTVLIGALVNFILNIPLIYYFQSVGAAVSSVVAESVIAVVQLVIVRKEISPLRVLKHGVNYFISGCFMYAFLMVTKKIFAETFANTAILALFGMLIYVAFLLIIRDDFLISNIKQVIKLVFKGKKNV